LNFSLEVDSDPGNDCLYSRGDINDNVSSASVTGGNVDHLVTSLNLDSSILSKNDIETSIDEEFHVP